MDTQPKKPSPLSVPPSSPVEEFQGFFNCSYPYCNYKSKWEENVGLHEKTHNPTANWNIPCEVCPQSFGFLVSFFYHMSSQHSNKLFCPWCLFLGEDLADFKTHMLAHIFTPSKTNRRKTKVNTTVNTLKVTLCAKSIEAKIRDAFNSIEFSKCKEQTETPKKTHRPSVSPSAKSPHKQIQKKEISRCSSNQNDLKKVTNDQRALLCCGKCSYKTSDVRNLRKHIRIHSSEKPFKCSNIGCNYKGRWAQNLRRHQGTCRRLQNPTEKSEETPVAAVVDKIKSEGIIETQMKKVKVIEREARLFNCSVCSFRSKWKSSLNHHLIVHTGQKPFHCPVKGCKYHAKWSHNLRRHASIVHRNKASKAPLKTKEHLGLNKECENKTESTADSSSGSFAFACMLCDFIGDSKMSALKHARQHRTVVISLNRI